MGDGQPFGGRTLEEVCSGVPLTSSYTMRLTPWASRLACIWAGRFGTNRSFETRKLLLRGPLQPIHEEMVAGMETADPRDVYERAAGVVRELKERLADEAERGQAPERLPMPAELREALEPLLLGALEAWRPGISEIRLSMALTAAFAALDATPRGVVPGTCSGPAHFSE